MALRLSGAQSFALMLAMTLLVIPLAQLFTGPWGFAIQGAFVIAQPVLLLGVAASLYWAFDAGPWITSLRVRWAIRKGQVSVWCQPQTDLQDGRFVGAEALIRWRHPRRGMVAPDLFIEAIEESSWANDFNLWVLAEVAAQVRAWQDAGREVHVAVNLSPVCFAEPRTAPRARDPRGAADPGGPDRRRGDRARGRGRTAGRRDRPRAGRRRGTDDP